MGIILKGNTIDETIIRNGFRKLVSDDLRGFAFLLYELAGLRDLTAMESRLDKITARRHKVKAEPGMKVTEPILDSENIKDFLSTTVESLCNSRYEQTIAARKLSTSLNALNWTPSNTKDAATAYLQNLMRKFATDFIIESGEKS